MIVALYGVAIAMVLVGAALAFYGYGIIMVERGWTLVIAGSIIGSSGAVLAGIGHLAERIAGIQRDTGPLRERFGRLDPATLPASPDAAAAPLAPAPRGPLDLPGDATGSGSETAAAEPPARPAPESRRPPVDNAPAPVLSDAPLRGSTAATPQDASAPDRTPESPREATGKPTVVGTYDSGGNHYVMFSDGSIEADTPNGVFRFGSLDELKDFIASGGEGGAVPA
jgi:hypothetical protein